MSLSRRNLLAASTAGIFAARLPGVGLAQGAPKRGGRITATWGGLEPQSLFVPGGGGSSPFMTSTKVLERLLAFTSDNRFEPVLATEVEAGSDFRSYTIKLQQ